MQTNFDITKIDSETMERLSDYSEYRDLYEGNFNSAFYSTIQKIRKRYPLDNTTAQSLISINLFWALTDFFKSFLTNQGIDINVDDDKQEIWNEIAKENNFISVLKEVFIDNSRFGNGLFKVSLFEGKPKIFSISPDCWIPVFHHGDMNNLEGHILIYPLEIVKDGQTQAFRRVEKHHKGFVENEIWTSKEGNLGRQLSPEEMAEFGLEPIEDFSQVWDDFLIFPTKNSTESDKYFGDSDYKRCRSIIEEIMLTVSQNSKIINRHANPKLTGSEQNLEHDPITNERRFPNADFLKVGTDGVKPSYLTADLQADAIDRHINTLMQYFYILTKTPPQAYGIGLSGSMSGESLRKIFIAALAKVDDIKQVSFNSTLQKVVSCAMAFNNTPAQTVRIAWNEPIPMDYSEMVSVENSRVNAGTQSKLTTIMTLDEVSEDDARLELDRIAEEKGKSQTSQKDDEPEEDEDMENPEEAEVEGENSDEEEAV